MANINAQEFQNIRIPIPPVTLQHIFRAIVEKVRQIQQIHKQHLKSAESLFAALSQRAFRGEL